MKLRMPGAVSCAAAFVPLLAACGGLAAGSAGIASDDAGHAVDAGRPLDAGHPVEAASCADVTSAPPAPDGASKKYGGEVIASIESYPGHAPGYSAYVQFSNGAFTDGFAGVGCYCQHGIPLPEPGFVRAGTISLLAPDCGPALAVFVPDPSQGYREPSRIKKWRPGEPLGVSATGDPGEIGAFHATLRTGALLTGVTPALGAAPVIVDRAGAFDVSWTPEGMSGETVTLSLGQVTTESAVTCRCTVPDSAGRIDMSPEMLSNFTVTAPGPSGGSGNLWLLRSILTAVSTDDAIIDLVGEVSTSADVTYR